jgi:hypothetical protein
MFAAEAAPPIVEGAPKTEVSESESKSYSTQLWTFVIRLYPTRFFARFTERRAKSGLPETHEQLVRFPVVNR